MRTNKIIEAIHEKKDAEFSCSTKDFYYIMPKTEHYRHLMVEEVNEREVDSIDVLSNHVYQYKRELEEIIY